MPGPRHTGLRDNAPTLLRECVVHALRCKLEGEPESRRFLLHPGMAGELCDRLEALASMPDTLGVQHVAFTDIAGMIHVLSLRRLEAVEDTAECTTVAGMLMSARGLEGWMGAREEALLAELGSLDCGPLPDTLDLESGEASVMGLIDALRETIYSETLERYLDTLACPWSHEVVLEFADGHEPVLELAAADAAGLYAALLEDGRPPRMASLTDCDGDRLWASPAHLRYVRAHSSLVDAERFHAWRAEHRRQRGQEGLDHLVNCALNGLADQDGAAG